MKIHVGLLLCLTSLGLVSGCSLLHTSNEPLSDIGAELDAIFHQDQVQLEEPEQQVVNPPATTIRFDGHEVVLGDNALSQITTDQFLAQLSTLLEQQRSLSARYFILRHRGIAEQVLWGRWITHATDPQMQFLAEVVSLGVDKNAAWSSLLATVQQRPEAARKYGRARSQFVERLKSEEPSDADADSLRLAAQKLHHDLALADAFQLLAVRELVAGRNAWAKSLFLQAIEVAEQHGDSARTAELWLMVATTANRAGQMEAAEQAWRGAIEKQLALCSAPDHVLDTKFWERIEQQRPIRTDWPQALTTALLKYAAPVGCRFSKDSPPEMVLRSALGTAQYDSGEPQLALVNFKQAETLAQGDDVLWLRIAQGKCLAALGQQQVAAALLSGPVASKNRVVSAAAMATLGSAKLQAGTYQQGAQMLQKALNEAPSLQWPARAKAEADLALARLIIGDTDQGLEVLRSVQKRFQQTGDVISLLQALENERSLLAHEGRMAAALSVQKRIDSIENS